MTDLLNPPSPSPELAPEPPPAGAGRVQAWVALGAIIGLLTLAVVSWGPWALFFIGALVVSIFLHEMGHFLAAKQAGMKVTEYFLGFGPRLWSFRRGETEYGIKPIPAGAYVKIIGMNNLDDVDPADEGRTYREKGYWKRLRVVLAGPAMNLAIAFVLLFILNFSFGTASPNKWTVAAALPGTAAAAADVREGDRVVSLAGQSVSTFDAFGEAIQANAGQQVDMVVDRDGQQVILTPTIGWALNSDAVADLAPLQTGDLPLAVNGTPVSNYAEFTAALAVAAGQTVPVKFERGGVAYTTTVTAPATMPDHGARGFLGVKSVSDMVHQGPVQALGSAGRDFKNMATGSLGGIAKFFSPSGLTDYTKLVFSTPPQGVGSNSSSATVAEIVPVDPNAVAVPAVAAPSPDDSKRVLSMFGVLRLGAQAGAAGLASALGLLALVNLFLGLINLLPLLPFDGGHAAIATYEAIKGKIVGRPYRVDIAKLMPVAYVVLAVFGFIFLSSTYLDAVRPVANPFSP